MIVPDLNLVLYAHFTAFREHDRAKKWWEALLNGPEEVGIPGVVLFGFLRLSTSTRVFTAPLSIEAALERVDSWLACPGARLLLPGPRHLAIAFALLRDAGTAANLTTDAQIAALAIEHQAEVNSNDSDFARFKGLRWSNPLDRDQAEKLRRP